MGRELPPVINEGSSGEITTELTLLAFARMLFALDFPKCVLNQRTLCITLFGPHAGGIQQRNSGGETRENEADAPIHKHRQRLQTILKKSYAGDEHRNRSQKADSTHPTAACFGRGVHCTRALSSGIGQSLAAINFSSFTASALNKRIPSDVFSVAI